MAAKKKSVEAKAQASRNDQVVRIIQLIKDLSQGEEDLKTLAERYGKNTRTIRRDLEAIEEAGIPVEKDVREDGTPIWWIEEDVNHLAGLDASHFLALTLALRDGNFRNQGRLVRSLEDLSRRVETAVGEKGRKSLAAIDRCFFSWDKFAWSKAPREVLLLLIDAIDGRRKCIVKYRAPSSGNTEKKFPVLPLRLFVHNGALYLHAWQPKFNTVLPLNLHRLAHLEVTDEVLPLPAGVDPDTLSRSAFGVYIGKKEETFELDFDAYIRPYIEERVWHPTQALTPLENGGLKLTFTCAPSYEVTNWVATWREHVQVVGPQSLKDELAKYGQWLIDQYAARQSRTKVSA